MKIWRLKKGADRRFRQGHPWIFSSELGHSSREVTAGEVVELRDVNNHFLAYGYSHPSSQICFRRLASREKDRDVLSVQFFIERLSQARALRVMTGWSQHSHRWLYAEADGTPGLIVDAFLSVSQQWVMVAQASTAGMERALPSLFEALEKFSAEFGDFTIVEAPSSRSRVLEGLKVGERRLVRGSASDLNRFPMLLQNKISLVADLWSGQKTGFFLDQQWNSSLLQRFLRSRFDNEKSGGPQTASSVLRVLDICCYVGQWSAGVAQTAAEYGLKCEVTLVDSSEVALSLAETNLQRLGAQAKQILGDALSTVGELDAGQFDVVICDPPAFVKKRADLNPGQTAYTKILRDAMRACKPGGWLVASSCSGLVKGEDWREILQQAAAKAGRTYKIFVSGGHGPDHPVRPEFPEGEYLKCEIGQIEFPS